MSMGIWAHHNPVRIYFGRGCRGSLIEMLDGQQVLIVCSPRGRQQLETDPMLAQALHSTQRLVWMDAVETNPDLNRLQNHINGLSDAQVDCVIALGGGSAIDAAKVFALALSPIAQNHSLGDLLGLAAEFPVGASLPLYALPTTAGTGSEVTPYATVWDHKAKKKLSLAGPAVYPHTAYVDPALSDTVQYHSTLHTGLDAINQAAESIWNRNMTPMSEMLAHRALKLGMMGLPQLVNDLRNPNLRDTMAEVSLLAGLAISQTRTSLCHSISYPLTAHFGVPHGLACAFTMPAVLRHSLCADDGRFERLARGLLPYGDGKPEDLLGYFDALNQQLNVAEQVRETVSSLEALTALREEMVTPGRAGNSLAQVGPEVLINILSTAWSFS